MKRKLLMILALLTVGAVTVSLVTIDNDISNDTVSESKISQSNENQEKTISEEEKETDVQSEITERSSDNVWIVNTFLDNFYENILNSTGVL